MKGTGVRRALIGVSASLGAAFLIAAAAGPAQAHGTPNESYENASESKGASVDSDRTYDSATNQTTFTFTLSLKSGSEPVSHVLFITCPDVAIVSTAAPAGANKADDGKIQNDNSIKDNEPGDDHVGVKYQPGTAGAYTIVFAGNIAAAQFVIKDGQGHAHFTEGQESEVCKPVTPSETTPTTVGGDTTPTTTGGNTTPTTTGGNTTPTTTGSNPGTNPASNEPSQPATEVQGATQTNTNTPAGTGTNVLSNTQSQPEALATLPRTGTDVGFLASIGVLLAAFGSVARTACRRS